MRTRLTALVLIQHLHPSIIISEALGHSSVAFTMDTYSHIIFGMQEDMMALLNEVLPSGVTRTSKERQNGEVHDGMPA